MTPQQAAVEQLRQIAAGRHTATTLAITSGKGGVGKSNLALNLSLLLAAGGTRVALVDADLGLANLDVLTDANAPSNLSHVVSGRRRLREIVVPLAGGVQLIPGASGIAKMAQLSEFQRAHLLSELAELEADNDIMVIDTGAGIGPDVLAFVRSADRTIIVTTPEPTAITDAYAMIKVLVRSRYAGQISLLVNQCVDRHEARALFDRIAGVTRQFLDARIFDAGYVLTDPAVPQAVRRRQPIVTAFPNSNAAKCIAALANRIGKARLRDGGSGGFFRRVASWFA